MNREHLVRRTVTDRNGVVTTRWVRRAASPSDVQSAPRPRLPRGAVKEINELHALLTTRLNRATPDRKYFGTPTWRYWSTGFTEINKARDERELGLLRALERFVPEVEVIWITSAYVTLRHLKVEEPEYALDEEHVDISRRLGDALLVRADETAPTASLHSQRPQNVRMFFHALQLAYLNPGTGNRIIHLLTERSYDEPQELTEALRASVGVSDALLGGAL